MALKIMVVSSPDRVDAAARIWAESTAARDGAENVAPLDLARPLIQAVLDSSPRSMLLVADDAGQTVGFAAVQPWGRARENEPTAEIRYVGVSPRVWRRGVGRQLMAGVPGVLAEAGYKQAVLMVYLDNTGAVRLYEGLGWRAEGTSVPHPRTGRREQLYVLDCLNTGISTTCPGRARAGRRS
ncbi:GNAT family N-acetyltransferase [Plantactinospora sp. GCM10030261]|uniref:GNAT family N-acetyltransferase n=1 Tax=Plantactinospora sp. GCM10030261 TaxID=3273420 RepID=UPI00361C2432